MKFLLALALAVSLVSTADATVVRIKKPITIRVSQPEIVYQDYDRGAVKIRIWNPLKNDVWVKFECRNVISKDIRVPHGTHNIYLTAEDGPITFDPCYIMKWEEIVR